MLLASTGWRPRMLPSASQRTGQPLATKNEPMSTVLWFKKASSRGQEFQPRKFKFQKSISYCRHQKTSWWGRQKLINGNSLLETKINPPRPSLSLFLSTECSLFLPSSSCPPTPTPPTSFSPAFSGTMLPSPWPTPEHLHSPSPPPSIWFREAVSPSHLENKINRTQIPVESILI